MLFFYVKNTFLVVLFFLVIVYQLSSQSVFNKTKILISIELIDIKFKPSLIILDNSINQINKEIIRSQRLFKLYRTLSAILLLAVIIYLMVLYNKLNKSQLSLKVLEEQLYNAKKERHFNNQQTTIFEGFYQDLNQRFAIILKSLKLIRESMVKNQEDITKEVEVIINYTEISKTNNSSTIKLINSIK